MALDGCESKAESRGRIETPCSSCYGVVSHITGKNLLDPTQLAYRHVPTITYEYTNKCKANKGIETGFSDMGRGDACGKE